MSIGPSADKNFGQHFLTNSGIIQKIVLSVSRLTKNRHSHVLEIGPGQGALTEALLKSSLKVTAIELDPRMVDHLKVRFAQEIEEGKFEIIFQDATRFDWPSWSNSRKDLPQVVCGNLPYNVGTAILFQVLEYAPYLEACCFMLQKEVIQRLMACKGTKEYGAPSVSLGVLCQVIESFWVSAGSFSPPPKVQSGVLSFERKKVIDPQLNPFSENTQYFKFSGAIRKAFQARRKMLRNTFPQLEVTEWGNLRAEQLSPEDWWSLWKKDLLSY